MVDVNQSHSKGQPELLGSMRCQVTLSPQTEMFLTFSNVSETLFSLENLKFGNVNHENIFHFHNIITNFELKNKMHWCKDSKAINDLGAFSLGHQDIQHVRSFS